MMNHEHAIYNKCHAFLQTYKCQLIPLHPPNMYMLELSHASTQCTHGAAVKLFAGTLA